MEVAKYFIVTLSFGSRLWRRSNLHCMLLYSSSFFFCSYQSSATTSRNDVRPHDGCGKWGTGLMDEARDCFPKQVVRETFGKDQQVWTQTCDAPYMGCLLYSWATARPGPVVFASIDMASTFSSRGYLFVETDKLALLLIDGSIF